ncbi:MAG: M17 family peptidase N-terminal domain-containing protein [Nitrospirota bacterium]
MKISIVSDKINRIYSEILLSGFFSDIRPIKGIAGDIDWIHNGIISYLIKINKVTGRLGETILIASQNKLPTSKILLMGLGKSRKYGYNEIRYLSSEIRIKLLDMGIRECSMELWGMEDCLVDPYLAVKSFMDGLKGYDNEILSITFLLKDKEKSSEINRIIKDKLRMGA